MKSLTKPYRPISWPTKGSGGDTGSWRTHRPVVNMQICTKCQICWIYCPEAVIDRIEVTIDLGYCKGCGICATECPTRAISMEKEE